MKRFFYDISKIFLKKFQSSVNQNIKQPFIGLSEHRESTESAFKAPVRSGML